MRHTQVRLPMTRNLQNQAGTVEAVEQDWTKPVEPDWKKLLALTHSPEASMLKTRWSTSSTKLLSGALF